MCVIYKKVVFGVDDVGWLINNVLQCYHNKEIKGLICLVLDIEDGLTTGAAGQIGLVERLGMLELAKETILSEAQFG